MKKYLIPEITLSTYEVDKDIAALEVNSEVDFDNGAADKDTFENLFSGSNK